jgi:hypothetical protein
MPLKKTGLFPNMPRRDRVVLAASAFLYLSAPFHKYCYGFQALGLLR